MGFVKLLFKLFPLDYIVGCFGCTLHTVASLTYGTGIHLCLTQRIRVSLTRGSRSQLPQQQQRTWRVTLILKLCHTP